MASSLRQLVHRIRRSLGWVTDDRNLEREADLDQAEQQLRDRLEVVDVERSNVTDPAPSSPESGRDDDDPTRS